MRQLCCLDVLPIIIPIVFRHNTKKGRPLSDAVPPCYKGSYFGFCLHSFGYIYLTELIHIVIKSDSRFDSTTSAEGSEFAMRSVFRGAVVSSRMTQGEFILSEVEGPWAIDGRPTGA